VTAGSLRSSRTTVYLAKGTFVTWPYVAYGAAGGSEVTVRAASANPRIVAATTPGRATLGGKSTLTLTARSVGKTKVTVTAAGGQQLVLTVIVGKKAQKVTAAKVTGVKTLATGGQVRLGATVKPARASRAKVTWSSANPAIATVDAAGLVTAHAAGRVRINATIAGKAKAAATVTVR
jgi:hypothetical protein